MNWHQRLAERRGTIFQKAPGDSLTKEPKAPFVTSVSDPERPFQNLAPVGLSDLRSHLLNLAERHGYPPGIVHSLVAEDVAACVGLTDGTLQAYLRALDRGTVMDRGIAPEGYTQAAHCDGCGPVWLWQGAPARLKGCPWCFHRKAGKSFARPAS